MFLSAHLSPNLIYVLTVFESTLYHIFHECNVQFISLFPMTTTFKTDRKLYCLHRRVQSIKTQLTENNRKSIKTFDKANFPLFNYPICCLNQTTNDFYTFHIYLDKKKTFQIRNRITKIVKLSVHYSRCP